MRASGSEECLRRTNEIENGSTSYACACQPHSRSQRNNRMDDSKETLIKKSNDKRKAKGHQVVEIKNAACEKPPKKTIYDQLEEMVKRNDGCNNDSNAVEKKSDEGSDEKVDKMEKIDSRNGVQNGMYPDTSERTDIYYFDHGNAAYFQTTDNPPPLLTEMYIEKSDFYATKFWAELFGSVHIFLALVTSFILQFIRFILHSLIRPLVVGIPQILSDYLLKPVLAIIFNGIIQPFLILLYNIATSFRDVCEPLAQAFGFWTRSLGILFHSIRIVDINKNKCVHCEQKHLVKEV